MRAAGSGSGSGGGGPAGGVASAGIGVPTQPSPSQYRWVVGSAGSVYQPGCTVTGPASCVSPWNLNDHGLGELVVEALLLGLVPELPQPVQVAEAGHHRAGDELHQVPPAGDAPVEGARSGPAGRRAASSPSCRASGRSGEHHLDVVDRRPAPAAPRTGRPPAAASAGRSRANVPGRARHGAVRRRSRVRSRNMVQNKIEQDRDEEHHADAAEHRGVDQLGQQPVDESRQRLAARADRRWRRRPEAGARRTRAVAGGRSAYPGGGPYRRARPVRRGGGRYPGRTAARAAGRGRRPAGRRRRCAEAASRGQCYRLPRASCSRSIASNSALKLPLPKPSEPCRSISSKKTVGRSCTGLVKICSR